MYSKLTLVSHKHLCFDCVYILCNQYLVLIFSSDSNVDTHFLMTTGDIWNNPKSFEISSSLPFRRPS